MKTPIARSLIVLVVVAAVVMLFAMATPVPKAQACSFVLDANAVAASCDEGGDTYTVSETHNNPGEGWQWDGVTGTGTFAFTGDVATYSVTGSWKKWIQEGHYECPAGYTLFQNGPWCYKGMRIVKGTWVDTSHWVWEYRSDGGTVERPDCYQTCSQTINIPNGECTTRQENAQLCTYCPILVVDARDQETVCDQTTTVTCEGAKLWCVNGVDTWLPLEQTPTGTNVSEGACTECQKNPNQAACAWHWYCDGETPTHTTEANAASSWPEAVRDTNNQAWVCTDIKMCNPTTGQMITVRGKAEWDAANAAGFTGNLAACQVPEDPGDPGEETGSAPTTLPLGATLAAILVAAAAAGLAFVKLVAQPAK